MARANAEQPPFVVPQSSIARDVGAFIVSKQAAGCSPKTIMIYCDALRAFAAYLERQGVHDAQSITPAVIRRWLLDLQQQGHNPGGVHGAFRVIRTWMRWLWAEHEYTGVCPIARVAAPKLPQIELEPVPLPDLAQMLATCDKSFVGSRDRALLLALLDSGTRASEFCSLDRDDLDLASGALHVRRGKGGKSRVTFVSARTMREVLRWLRWRGDAPGALWVSANTGARLTTWGLRQVLAKRCRQAGLYRTWSAHAFRRACAIGLLRNGCDIMSLQKLLGHSSLAVLRRYLLQTESDLQQAHERASPVDRMLSRKERR